MTGYFRYGVWLHGIIMRSRYRRELMAACHGLDEERLTAAWAEGRAKTLEQVIAYALEVSNPE
jgi:hypothetical protein